MATPTTSTSTCDLTEGIFRDDLRTGVNTYRQNLQLMYVEALIKALDDKSRLNMVAQSVVLDQLRRIDRAQRDAALPDGLTRTSRAHSSFDRCCARSDKRPFQPIHSRKCA